MGSKLGWDELSGDIPDIDLSLIPDYPCPNSCTECDGCLPYRVERILQECRGGRKRHATDAIGKNRLPLGLRASTSLDAHLGIAVRQLDLDSFPCRLPVNLIQAFLEVSGQTSPKETADAQEQIH